MQSKCVPCVRVHVEYWRKWFSITIGIWKWHFVWEWVGQFNNANMSEIDENSLIGCHLVNSAVHLTIDAHGNNNLSNVIWLQLAFNWMVFSFSYFTASLFHHYASKCDAILFSTKKNTIFWSRNNKTTKKLIWSLQHEIGFTWTKKHHKICSNKMYAYGIYRLHEVDVLSWQKAQYA